MVSFKNGVLKVDGDRESTVRTIYEICFVLNIVTVSAFQSVKFIGTATGIMMLCAAVLLWIGRRDKRVIIPYNSVWYILFTSYAVVSSLWASYVNVGIVLYFMRLVVIIAIVTSVSIYVDTAEDLERITRLYILGISIIAVIEMTYVPIENWAAGRFGTNFSGDNANSVSFMVFCAELMAFYEFYAKGKKRYFILVVVFLVFIALTGSRKALFAAVAGPIMFVVLSVYKKNYLFNILLIATVAILVVFYVFTDESMYGTVGLRMENMLDFWFSDRSYNTDSSLYMRSYYIQLAQELFSKSPLWGNGMYNFSLIAGNEYNVDVGYSHNNYWQVLSELGIIGFIIYYSFYLTVIVKLIKGAFVNKSRLSLLFLTFMVLLLVLEIAHVTYHSKIPQMVIAIAYTATYVSEMDGRKYQYIGNNVANQ